MWKKKCGYVILLTYFVSCIVQLHAQAQAQGSHSMRASGRVVRKEERWPVVSTDYGQISAVRINDSINGSYLLHFFSLEPNALLLPLLLNADMLLYVNAGSGRLSWTEEDELKHIDLKRGDVYRLLHGTVFYIITQSKPQQQQHQTLNIHAIFPNSNDDDLREAAATVEPYLSVQDIVLGFDKKILQATFKVSEEVIDELLGATKPPLITNVDTICRGFSETRSCNILQINNKNKKDKKEKEKEKEKEKKHERSFNLFEVEKEVENCHGWASAVRNKQLAALEGSNIGVFIVSLKAGSMMAPRWDTSDTEIVVVLEGRGAVRMFSPSITKEAAEGRNVGFEVAEGDVFAVPTFSPAAEMAFNNGSFVFMGFMKERNKGQSITGGDSVLQLLSKDVLQILFNVKSTTLDEILAPREDTVISACTSCAEEVMRHTKGREEETGRHRRRGGDEGKGREESRHGREEERQREEEEEARWRHGEAEEEAPWRRGGEREPQRRQNHHNYEQGGRRILKRN